MSGALLTIALLGLTTLANGQSPSERPFFETGVVQAGAPGLQHCYPVVARAQSGALFAVWSRVSQIAMPPGQEVVIVGAFSRDGGRAWDAPKTLIATPGMGDYDPNIVVDDKRILVYSTTTKIDLPLIDHSEVWMTYTEDEGATWTKPVRLDFPFKYLVGKRHIGIKLKDGALAMPFSWDLWAQAGTPARTEGEMDLKSGILISEDRGLTWKPFGDLHLFAPKTRPYGTGGLCEPALVELANGELLMLMRTGTSWLYEARSRDRGRTWTKPKPSRLAGFNTPMALWRLDQNSKEVIVIWNNSPVHRFPLCTAISADGGRTWSPPKDVAGVSDVEVSYPGITQAPDGTFVAVWQQMLPAGGRDVRWARFNRAWVLAK
jgi:predicted neuraminidase